MEMAGDPFFAVNDADGVIPSVQAIEKKSPRY